MGPMGPRGPQGFQGFPGMPARPSGPPVIIQMPDKMSMQVSVVSPHNLWKPTEAKQGAAAPAPSPETPCDCGCGNEVDPCSTPLQVNGATEINAKYPCTCDKTPQQLSRAGTGQQGVTKGDLEAAVERIVSAEAKALGLDGAQAKVSLGQDPSLAKWCYDNNAWKGPYGDKCTAYRVGGDRNFWCEWDGADAPNACPYSCASCTLRMKAKYMAAHAVARKDPTALEQQQTPAPAHQGSTGAPTLAKAQPEAPAVTAQARPAQMLAQKTASAKLSRTALVQEVAQLKERLTAIAKATGYNMAHAKDGAGKMGMSDKAAANDMQNFWAKMTAGHGSSDGSTRVINSAHDANRQLGNFFDSLPVGGKKGGGGHAAEVLPAGAEHMSPYEKEYLASVLKKYGVLAAQQVVEAVKDGRQSYVARKDGQGAPRCPHCPHCLLCTCPPPHTL